MLKQILFSILFFTIFSLQAQVGVGTTEPHPDVMLDVNGGLRIRSHNEGSDDAAKDSLVVLDGRGVVHRIATSTLLANMDKSLVKAKLTSNYSIAAGSYLPIIFNNEEFDIKEEFDTSTGVFTAGSDGIYRVTAQMKTASVSVGDLGLAIYKTDTGGSSTKIAEERFINVAVDIYVLGVIDYELNVSPPTRTVSTLIQLSAGEKISLRLFSAVSVNVLGSTGGSDSFCTIEQVR